MIGTLVTEENSDFFLGAIPVGTLVDCDFYIGVVCEEDDTACGVLGARAVEDHRLEIVYLYVADRYRRRGAGTCLVDTLIGVAQDMDATSVFCDHAYGYISDGVPELLLRCDFLKIEESVSPIYAVYASELELEEKRTGFRVLPLSDIPVKTWGTLPDEWMKNHGNELGYAALSEYKGVYDENHSFVAYDTKGAPVGMLLISFDGTDYQIEALTARGGDSSTVLYTLMEAAIRLARKDAAPDTRVIVRPEDESALKLLEYVSGGAYIRVGETALYTYDII